MVDFLSKNCMELNNIGSSRCCGILQSLDACSAVEPKLKDCFPKALGMLQSISCQVFYKHPLFVPLFLAVIILLWIIACFVGSKRYYWMNQVVALLHKNTLLWRNDVFKFLKMSVFSFIPVAVLSTVILLLTRNNQLQTIDCRIDNEVCVILDALTKVNVIEYKVDFVEFSQLKSSFCDRNAAGHSTSFTHEVVDSDRIEMYQNLRPVLGLLFFISFVGIISNFVSDLVMEKQLRIKGYIRMTGVASWIQILSDFTVNTIKSVPLSLGLAALAHFGGIFPNQHLALLFSLFHSFLMSMTAICYVVSVFFSNRRTAVISTLVVLTSMYILVYKFIGASLGDQLAITLFPPVGLGLIINQMSHEASIGGGHVINIYRYLETTKSNRNIDVTSAIFMFLFDTLFYYVTGWYLDKVLPQMDGAPHPWYFPFSFLLDKYYPKDSSVTPTEQEISSDKIEKFTEEELKMINDNECISIKSLRKVFPVKGSERVALDNISVHFLKNEISCLLGHNGAGKSTLFSILNGAASPSSGDAMIFGLSLKKDLDAIRRYMSFCPQYNAFYETLTVKQNLYLFGILKSSDRKSLDERIGSLCKGLNIADKLNVRAGVLSGGQKRKLSIAIALIGDSKVVIFDEPSAGMDPLSRRQTWDVIQKYRKDKVIVLTTHFLDEADFLGDKIMIMDQGKLGCSGRSLFLKEKFSKGFRLEFCHPNPTVVTEVVNSIAERKLETNFLERQGKTVTFLPTDTRKKISKILKKLNDFTEISEISLSPPMLEDIFLSFTKDSFQKRESNEITVDNGKVKINKIGISRHVRVLLWKRLKMAINDKKLWILLFILPMIIMSIPLIIPKIDVMKIIDPKMAVRSEGPPICVNNIGKYNCDDKTHRFMFGVKGFSEKKCIENGLPRSTNHKRCMAAMSHCKKYPWLCSTEICCKETNKDGPNYACRPSDYYFIGYSSQCPSKFISLVQIRLTGFVISFVYFLAFMFIPAISASQIVKENESHNNTKFQQIASGVRARSYWISNFVWDFVLMLILSCVSMIFVRLSIIPSSAIFYLFSLSVMYSLSIISLFYALSFFFADHSKMITFAVVFNLVTGAAMGIVSYILTVVPIDIPNFHGLNSADLLDKYLVFALNISPAYGFMDGYIKVILHSLGLENPENFLMFGSNSLWANLWIKFAYMMLVIILSWSFITFKETPKLWKPPKVTNPIECADQDVNDEKQKLLKAKVKDPICINGLTKHYKKKKALTDVWFGVPNGQCFGYLGVNGAGKSTTIKLLTGIQRATRGRAYLDGRSIDSPEARDAMGYCPQFDALFMEMSVIDHLRLYAGIRGVDDIVHVESWLDKLNMKAYRDVAAGKLSGGNQRKLSFAIAVIGHPPVVFLDEPSTGLDSFSKRFLWKVIDETLMESKCAMMLTTHSLEECEALCDRIAILMDGQIHCIGSINHIKEKYGKEFTVEMYFQSLDDGKVKTISSELGGRITEHHNGRLVVNILKSKFSNISAIYDFVESSIETWGVERYCVGTASLEDVFNDIAKKQSSLQEQ